MTALCGGNTSHIKPGINNLQLFGSGLLAQRLAAAGGIWMQALASAVGVMSLNLQDVCTKDPPAMPVFTAADLAAIPNPLIQPDNLNALQKMRDALVNLFWWDFCDCDVVATPPPVALPPKPAGAPDFSNLVNPAGPCLSIRTDRASGVIPNGSYDAYRSPNANPFPRQTTAMSITANIAPTNGGVGDHFTMSVAVSTTGVTNVFNSPQFPLDGTDHVYTITLPTTFTGGVLVDFQVQGVGIGVGDQYSLAVDAFSGCTPGQTGNVPCCPADLYTTSTLQQILTTVTLLQRQIAPFAYIPGTVHANVSGAGEFAITTPLLGLRVDVPLVPSRAGLIVGDPTRYWDLGEVSLGDADGWFYRRRIDTSSLVWTPKDAQLSTRIGYNIPADMHVTITEIKREP